MTTLAESLATRAQTLGQQIISDLSPLYQNGVFYQSAMDNYHLSAFPHAALMATLAKYASSDELAATYKRMIAEIVTRALSTNTTSAGLFVDGSVSSGPFAGFYGQGPDRASMGTTFGDTTAIEQTANLAWILTQLPATDFSSGQWASWLHACQVNCDYLDTRPDGATPDTIYYINGNYNCQLLGAYWFTALCSTNPVDKAKYESAYERALAFLVDPNSVTPGRWAGYGLITDVAPAEYDWSDGQAHLTETNGNTTQNPSPTFDANYSMIQLDTLSRVFLVNRDTRLVRLINAITGKVETKLDPVTWVIDGTGGSRQNHPQGYRSCYYEVSALLGAKASNTTYLDSVHTLNRWDNRFIGELTSNSTNGNYAAGVARQLSLAIAPVRHAAELAKFKVMSA